MADISTLTTDTKDDVEKIAKFKKVFADTALSIVNENNTYLPLVMKYCNGNDNYPFSDAFIEYETVPGFPITLWYSSEFEAISAHLQGKATFQKEVIDSLIDCATSDEHMTCLSSLLLEKSDESMIRAVLAIHYFQPLVLGSKYTVDKSDKAEQHCRCKEIINYDVTSFGNKIVWHGTVDILLQRSVIKIAKADDDDDDDDGDEGKGDESNNEAFRESLHKQMRVQSDFTSLSEVKIKNIYSRKTMMQALAQAITNAYYESHKDKSQFNKFIPSFLATEKHINIILYNCKLDILLLSEELEIWELPTRGAAGTFRLNYCTLMQVWLTLNCEKFCGNVFNHILERTPNSNFRQFIGEDILSTYLCTLSRPLKPSVEAGMKTPCKYLDFDALDFVVKSRKELFEKLKQLSS